MKCPHCHIEIPLTWRRYLVLQVKRILCPNCSNRVGLRISALYVAGFIVPAAVIVLCVPALVALVFDSKSDVYLMALVAALANLPRYDKFAHEIFSELK